MRTSDSLRSWSCVVSPGDDGTSGDFAVVREIDPERTIVALVDIGSGRGHARAARRIANVAAAAVAGSAGPDEALSVANRAIRDARDQRIAAGYLFVALVDRVTAAFRYAAAAHEGAVLLQRDGMHRHLVATGPPLGVADAPAFGARRVPMHPGSCLVSFTGSVPAAPALRSAWIALRAGTDPAVAIVEDARRDAQGELHRDCGAVVIAMTPFPADLHGLTYRGGACLECDQRCGAETPKVRQ